MNKFYQIVPLLLLPVIIYFLLRMKRDNNQVTASPWVSPWTLPAAGEPYRQFFEQSTKKYGLPGNLLARLAYQESKFLPEIITGQTVSQAGATGMMQIVPRFHPEAEPLNPEKAIDYAASYLKQNYDKFGTWRLALMAYNWGPGNIDRYQKGEIELPLQVNNYAENILKDV